MNLLDDNDKRFYNFRKILDARMKEISSKGIGLNKKQADPILCDDENLWEKSLLGGETSIAMYNTAFCYNCTLFGLTGVDEHRSLTCDQFILGHDAEGTYIEFQGKTSKIFNGGLNKKKTEPKKIKHYSCATDDMSLYIIYSQYLDLIGSTRPFYRRPIDGPTPRFSSQVVGVNKLSNAIKTMCAEAGLRGNYSNHSGKRTCATSLFQNGVDEQLIMERTGHRSDAVRKYKRTSSVQQSEVSKFLDPLPKKNAASVGYENLLPNIVQDVKR